MRWIFTVRAAGWTVANSYEALKPWIRHLHVHDGVDESNNLILKPIGEGAIDHRAAVAMLKADRYDGFLSGEWIGWEPYQTHLPRELATLKRYEKEIEQSQE